MAFVFGKSIKNTTIQGNNNVPGPGEYYPPNQHDCSQFSAPFNASSFKQSIFDVNASNTGPGSYDPIYPKDISSINQQKINSNFKSKVQRFKTQSSPIERQLSPKVHVSLLSDKERSKQIQIKRSKDQKQQYKEAMNRTKHMMSNIQQNNNKRKINSIMTNKDYVRIILSSPKNTQLMHSVFIDKHITKRQKGPGSYQLADDNQIMHKRSKNVTDWSKNKERRFKTQKDKNPGPGQYSLNVINKKGNITQNTAAFASTAMRSHMDEIIYKTKMPFKVRFIEQKKLKDKYPGPGQYDPHLIISKSFHYGQANFGSVNHNDFRQQEQVPGPGYYGHEQKKSKMKQQLKKIRQKIFGKKPKNQQKVQTLQSKNKEQLVKQFLKQLQNQKNKYYSLQQRCTSKAGNFSFEQRFKEKQLLANTLFPGPGQYKLNNSHSLQNACRYNHGFNSTQKRNFIQQKVILNLPFYDVEKNDIGKKAIKIKRNIQNLKMIDIEKAPFNCRQKRHSIATATEKSLHKQQQKIPFNEIQRANIERYPRQIILKREIFLQRQKRETSVFRSTTKRDNFESSSAIGPGHYTYNKPFEKKSFNKQYNYKPPCKVRSSYLIKSTLK